MSEVFFTKKQYDLVPEYDNKIICEVCIFGPNRQILTSFKIPVFEETDLGLPFGKPTLKANLCIPDT